MYCMLRRDRLLFLCFYTLSIACINAANTGSGTPKKLVKQIIDLKTYFDEQIKTRAPQLNPNVVYGVCALVGISGALYVIKHTLMPIALGAAYGFGLSEATQTAEGIGQLITSVLPLGHNAQQQSPSSSPVTDAPQDDMRKEFTTQARRGAVLGLLCTLYLGPQPAAIKALFLASGIIPAMIFKKLIELKEQPSKTDPNTLATQAAGFVMGFGVTTMLGMAAGARISGVSK